MKWKLPLEGWYKAYFNSVAKGNIDPSGCGGIIRSSHGVGVASLSYSLGTYMNHYAKASATLHTMKLA